MNVKFILVILMFSNWTILNCQNYVLSQNNDFTGFGSSSITTFDCNNDGFEDVLVTGRTLQLEGESTKLYINDGEEGFEELLGTPFSNIYLGTVAVSDVNNDGNIDVFLAGINSVGQRVAKLYFNNGNNIFEEVQNTTFHGVSIGSAAFSDIDQDGDPDLLVTGLNDQIEESTILYINNGLGVFNEIEDTPFVNVVFSSISFSDIDNNGFEDLIITGMSENDLVTKLYINNGNGEFIEFSESSIVPVKEGAVGFIDYNNDNFVDIVITGYGETSLVAKLYENVAGEFFSEVLGTPFHEVLASDVDFADVDNNGFQDILIVGGDFQSNYISEIYLNNGDGTFTEMLDNPFIGVVFGSVSFSDVNGDGMDDVFISGCKTVACSNPILELYINEGQTSSSSYQSQANSNQSITIFPNPTIYPSLKLYYNSVYRNQIFIKVFNVNGKLLMIEEKQVEPGINIIPLNLNSLSSGQFYIQLESQSNTIISKVISIK